ncbi:MAG: hypothetical protein KA059_01875 [Elusimicrobiales bacterium]|nr:hypothetical protein [Elusimicrobiales bacterium]
MYKVLGFTEKLQVKVKIEVKNKTTNPHQNRGQKSEIRYQINKEFL